MSFLAASAIPAGTGVPPSKLGIAGMVRASKSIVSVSGATARAQAVTDWPTATGQVVSAANPVIVYRQDTDAIEVSENGTTWATFTGKDTGWVSAAEPTGWTTNTSILSRVTGSVCNVYGIARPDAGTIAVAASGVTVCTLTAGHRPATTLYVPAVCWVNGGTPPYVGDAAITIDTAGVMQIFVPRTATGVLINVAFMVA